jgi:cytochrome P450
MSRLSYVEHVVFETLRLYPSAWAIRREAVCDTEIGGQRVAKGTTVLLSPWVLHRDPRIFSEPLEFRPERWSDGLAASLPRLAYLPFGGGQRTCIGSGFALTEAMVILTLITQRFRVELVESSRTVTPVPVLTLQPSGDVLVRLTKR